jgi:ferritin-like metal-binding protein YciE
MDSMREAFEDLIKDIHNAEKQIEKALPKVMKKVTDENLKQAMAKHLEETKNQAKMVEEIAKQCGFKHTGKVCHGMMGIIEENTEHLSEKPSAVLDAMIICGAQKIEHYEIVGYGTARAWAQQLGFNQVVPMIEQILHEEEATDKKLNEIALNMVNQEAMQQPESEGKSSKASSSKSNGKSGSSSKSKSSTPRGKVSVR